MKTYKCGTTLRHPATGEKVGEIKKGWLEFTDETGGFPADSSVAQKFISLCEIREPEPPFEKVGLEELTGVANAIFNAWCRGSASRTFWKWSAEENLRQIVEDYRKEKGQGK